MELKGCASAFDEDQWDVWVESGEPLAGPASNCAFLGTLDYNGRYTQVAR